MMAQGARWEHLQYLPYALLRRKWQWHLLTHAAPDARRPTRSISWWMRVSGQYPNGLVTNVQKGAVPSQYQSVARYVAKYVVSPPICGPAHRSLRWRSGSRTITAPTGPTGWSMKPWRSTRLLAGWCSYVASHIAALMWRTQLCGEDDATHDSTSLLRQALTT